MSFSVEQVTQLLRAIHPDRVLHTQGQSHVSQQDIRAHLTRIFGYGYWDKEILRLECLRDVVVTLPAVPAQGNKPAKPERKIPGVSYLCTLRLTVRCPTRCCISIHEDVGTGTSPNLPDYGDAHDFAAKNAVSYALKRCATDWGDQFGLALYNKGQTKALVRRTLVGGPAEAAQARGTDDMQEGVPQQVSLGEDAPDSEAAPPAAPTATEQAGPPADNRTAEQVELDETRSAVRAFVIGRGWNGAKVERAFRKTYGLPSTALEVTAEQLTSFLVDLQLEAQQEDDEKAKQQGQKAGAA